MAIETQSGTQSESVDTGFEDSLWGDSDDQSGQQSGQQQGDGKPDTAAPPPKPGETAPKPDDPKGGKPAADQGKPDDQKPADGKPAEGQQTPAANPWEQKYKDLEAKHAETQKAIEDMRKEWAAEKQAKNQPAAPAPVTPEDRIKAVKQIIQSHGINANDPQFEGVWKNTVALNEAYIRDQLGGASLVDLGQEVLDLREQVKHLTGHLEGQAFMGAVRQQFDETMGKEEFAQVKDELKPFIGQVLAEYKKQGLGLDPTGKRGITMESVAEQAYGRMMRTKSADQRKADADKKREEQERTDAARKAKEGANGKPSSGGGMPRGGGKPDPVKIADEDSFDDVIERMLSK